MKDKVGFLKKTVLKLLTRMQTVAIKGDNSGIYLVLTKLHFWLYFGKSLEAEALIGSPAFKAAADRHGSMVVSLLHGESKRKKYIFELATESFQKDLILKARI